MMKNLVQDVMQIVYLRGSVIKFEYDAWHRFKIDSNACRDVHVPEVSLVILKIQKNNCCARLVLSCTKDQISI